MAIPNFVRTWVDRKRGRSVVRLADAHRDRASWTDAAPLYLQGHALMPWRNDLLVQAGNCRKEAGDFAEAVRLYQQAADDPAQSREACRQMGDVDDRVSALWEWGRSGYSPRRDGNAPPFDAADAFGTAYSMAGHTVIVPDRHVDRLGQLSPRNASPGRQLDPTTGRPLRHSAHLELMQLGNFMLDGEDGPQPLLTGIIALRVKVVCYSQAPNVRVSLDGGLIADEALRLVRRYPDGRLLHTANMWIDCARLPAGARTLRVEAALEDGTMVYQARPVTVAAMPPTFALPGSDAFVPSPAAPYTDLATEVGARAAIIRHTADMATADGIRSVLAIRIDQLGDLSSSLPALRRLRELYPDAHLAALVASSLSAIVSASGLADEVIGLTTTYDETTEQRHLDEGEAQRLRGTLRGRSFDIAIDLSPNRESRHLLLLAEARCRVGFSPQQFPFLDFGVDITSRDKANNHSTQSHASLVQSLVELLDLKTRPLLPPVKRRVDDRGTLERYGLRAGGYIVVHCGARHAINRWPQEKFWRLAGALHRATGLKVLMFPDGREGSSLPSEGAEDGIVTLPNVPTESFDAIVANAHALIGNDSGPKHLAAVRGTWTTSIHINRLNWNEWGQNGPGLIISKKTPCGGCGLNDEHLCGKEVACLRTITVEEVFDAIIAHLPPIGTRPAG